MELALDPAERREVRRRARAATIGALRSLGGEARRGAIRDHALVHGGFTARELAAPPPERGGEKYKSLVEHDLSWALTNLRRDGLVDSPRWTVWRLAEVAATAPPSAVPEPCAEDRLQQLRAMSYRLYLQTPEWRRTRAAALMRAGERCALDATHAGPCDVHHNSYDRLGAELAGDLIVLCRECHELHHRAHGRPRRSGAKDASAVQRRPSLLRRLLTAG